MNERIVDQPRPGYFKVRLVKRGPWVPMVIFEGRTDEDGTLEMVCEIGIAESGIIGHGTYDPLFYWAGAHEVGQLDWMRMRARITAALEEGDPRLPELNPCEPVRLSLDILKGTRND